MASPAPSIHAARAGAWALLLVVVVDLVVDVGSGALFTSGLSSPDDWDRRRDALRWLDWFGDAAPLLQLVLFGVVLVALLRLRRGTADAVARGMFLGACVLWSLRPAVALAFELFSTRGDYDAWGFGVDWEQFLDRLRLVATTAERVGLGLVLAAIWRVRRAWGRTAGPAWTIAAIVYGLRLVVVLLPGLGLWGPTEVDADGFMRRQLLVYGLLTVEVAALAAALVAFARAAPPEPVASRWLAAAAGLDLYFRAIVTRATVLVVGVVVTLMFSLGGTTPKTRAVLLIGTLGLQIPAVVAQIAGLTRYSDAPAAIGRAALWTALVGIGVGLAGECLVIASLVDLGWGAPSTWGDRGASPEMIRAVAWAGQTLGLVAGVALLVSLRRAATSVGAAGLRRRAGALALALVGVAAVAGAVVYGLGDAVVRSPVLVLGFGVVALVFGVTVFIAWLRLIEGVAQEMRQRAAL